MKFASRQSRLRRGVLVALAVVVGVALRLSVTFTESPDCLYHLRRAVFALRHFPRTIIFDPLINWPHGGIGIWPPLFDLALALPARIFHGSGASLAQLVQSAQWVPIVFAAGAIVAAGFAGDLLDHRWGAAAAAFFVAVCPGHLQYSQFGHTDQHVAESFWGFWALGLFLRAARRNSRVLELLAGVALAGAVLTWQGAIFWAVIFALALWAAAVRGRDENLSRAAFLTLGLPAFLVWIATAFWTQGLGLPFTYVSFGTFQPAFLCATFAVVCLGILFLRFRRVSRGERVLLCAGILLAAVAPVLRAREFAAMVMMGVRHLASASTGGAIVAGGLMSYSRQWLRQIVEYRPLLADGWGWPLGFLSFSFFLSPIALFFWGRRVVRREHVVFNDALLVWGGFTFLWTLFQRRNVYYAALLGGLAGIEIARQLALHRRAKRPAAVAVFVLLALPMLIYLPKAIGSGYTPPPGELAAMKVLSRVVPEKISPYDPRDIENALIPGAGAGDAGVMAFWSQGHAIEFLAGRPTVANNFGYGYFDSLRFFFAQTESEALAIAQRDRFRYVLTLDIFPLMENYAASLGRGGYLGRAGNRVFALPRYFETIQARLAEFNGAPVTLADGERVAPLTAFHLVWQSREGSWRGGRFIPRWKIFEILRAVPGREDTSSGESPDGAVRGRQGYGFARGRKRLSYWPPPGAARPPASGNETTEDQRGVASQAAPRASPWQRRTDQNFWRSHFPQSPEVAVARPGQCRGHDRPESARSP